MLSHLWFHVISFFHHQDPQPDKAVASRGDPDHSVHLNADDAHRAEKRSGEGEYRERRSRDLDVDVEGEAEEEAVLQHFPKKRKSSESFEAYSGPAASHYEENNLKGKQAFSIYRKFIDLLDEFNQFSELCESTNVFKILTNTVGLYTCRRVT